MRRRKEKELYFANKEEQAVINYALSNSKSERDEIYNGILKEPFRKMVQSILRKYPIHIGNYSMEEVEAYALSHLIEQMVKYKPFIIERRRDDGVDNKWYKLGDKYRFIYAKDAEEKLRTLNDGIDGYKYRIFNSKAFSYCQTIVRNYFKDHGKKSYNDKKINLSFDDYVDEINQNMEYNYEMEDDHENLDLLIEIVVKRIKDKITNDPIIKKNEVIVGEAIAVVLENWDVLFLEDSPEGKFEKKVTNKFAKNKILFYLKEQTGLTTKEIRMAMKPFKDIYFIEKENLFEE